MPVLLEEGAENIPRGGAAFIYAIDRKIKGRFFRCRPYMLGGRR